MAFVMSQRLIDRETLTVPLGPVTKASNCAICGANLATYFTSPVSRRGRLYLTRPSDPEFDSSQAVALCGECWPRWLMWRARFGFDLHKHGPGSGCDPACIARSGGRRAQYVAQMSMLGDRDANFFLIKAIDGLPRVNGSHLIMAQRMSTFMYRTVDRQFYYEMLPDAEQAQHILRESARWSEGLGISQAYTDHIQIVVEAFESWRTAPRGRIPLPTPGDPSIGLHAVLVTGYEDSGATLNFINSWGPHWGNHGYGTMPFEYLERHFHDAVVTRRARWGFTNAKLAHAENLSTQDLRGRFLVENPRYRGRLRIADDDNWQTSVYELQSPWTGRLVSCVEIANGFGLKMGWAFCRYLPPDIVEVPELFVWPTFRRMGVGRILEGFATECAQNWECDEIRLMLNEADAVLGPPRKAARLFAQERGYEWKWRQEVGPRRPGTAYKSV
ncbi:MAG: GNAT family N-acetyltransferase [Solirubrobacteraceae bacterium]